MAFLAISSAKELARIPLGPFVGVLLGEVRPAGLIDYGHVLDVVDPRTGKRVLAIASERNKLAGTSLGGGSHFLCAYVDGTHVNYGSSDDHADRDRFLTRALELAREHLKLPPEPEGAFSNQPAAVPLAPTTAMLSPKPLPATAPLARPAGDRTTLGMLLTLAGAALVALTLLGHFAPVVNDLLYSLSYFVGPRLTGYVLFIVGCFLTDGSAAGSGAVWVRRAGLLAGVAAALGLAPVLLGQLGVDVGEVLALIPSLGVFMLALGCHAGFLLRLAEGLGLLFRVGPALRLLWLWVLLTGARAYATYVNHGHEVPEWLDLATLLGMVVWAVFQILMTVQARRPRGRRKRAGEDRGRPRPPASPPLPQHANTLPTFLGVDCSSEDGYHVHIVTHSNSVLLLGEGPPCARVCVGGGDGSRNARSPPAARRWPWSTWSAAICGARARWRRPRY